MLFEKCLKWIDLFYMKLNILYSRAVFQSNCQATLKLTLKNVAKKEKKQLIMHISINWFGTTQLDYKKVICQKL